MVTGIRSSVTEQGIALFFDPGNYTGWARFDRTELVACGLTNPEDYLLLPETTGLDRLQVSSGVPVSVLIEDQQIYRQSHQTSDPNNLIPLAHKVGDIRTSIKQFCRLRLGLTVPAEVVKPAEWKGQRSKEICHAQMLAKLSVKESTVLHETLKRIRGEFPKLDVRDAVCLGLWGLRRAR